MKIITGLRSEVNEKRKHAYQLMLDMDESELLDFYINKLSLLFHHKTDLFVLFLSLVVAKCSLDFQEKFFTYELNNLVNFIKNPKKGNWILNNLAKDIDSFINDDDVKGKLTQLFLGNALNEIRYIIEDYKVPRKELFVKRNNPIVEFLDGAVVFSYLPSEHWSEITRNIIELLLQFSKAIESFDDYSDHKNTLFLNLPMSKESSVYVSTSIAAIVDQLDSDCDRMDIGLITEKAIFSSILLDVRNRLEKLIKGY